jgi:hypothetical protein
MLPENENGLAFPFDIHGTGLAKVQVGGQIYPSEVLRYLLELINNVPFEH